MNEHPEDTDFLMARHPGAFADLVEKYQSMVYTICLNVVKSEPLAEEAAQDTFVKVYRKIGSFEQQASFKTWLYRIAYNTAIDYYRKKRVKLISMDEEDSVPVRDPSDNQQDYLERKEAHEVLHENIGKLPPDQSVILTLYYLEEKSVKDICECMGLTDSNVKIKLFRARKALRTLLEKTNKDLFA